MPSSTTSSQAASSVGVSWPMSRSSSSSSTTSWPETSTIAARRGSQSFSFSSTHSCRRASAEMPSSYIADEDLLIDEALLRKQQQQQQQRQSSSSQSLAGEADPPGYHVGPEAYKARKAAQEKRRREAMKASTRRVEVKKTKTTK